MSFQKPLCMHGYCRHFVRLECNSFLNCQNKLLFSDVNRLTELNMWPANNNYSDSGIVEKNEELKHFPVNSKLQTNLSIKKNQQAC